MMRFAATIACDISTNTGLADLNQGDLNQ